MERVVFEDVPANLAAIKRRVESLHVGAAVGDGGCWGRKHCVLTSLPPSLPSPTHTQLEAELAQLESEGEGSAAALLRRRLERPPLAGGSCGSRDAPLLAPPDPPPPHTHLPTHPPTHPQAWWTTLLCWLPSWSAALAPSARCLGATSCAT